MHSRKQFVFLLFGLSVFFWYFGIESTLYSDSTPADYNNYSGVVQQTKVRSYTYYSKRRYQSSEKKKGYELMIMIQGNPKTFYIGNKLEKKHYDYKRILDDSEKVSIWSQKESGDGEYRECVYQMKVDGRMTLPLQVTVQQYGEVTYIFLMLAILCSIGLLLATRPKLWKALVTTTSKEIEEKKEADSNIYSSMFEKKSSLQLQEMIDNPSDYTEDAIKTARKILKQRNQ